MRRVSVGCLGFTAIVLASGCATEVTEADCTPFVESAVESVRAEYESREGTLITGFEEELLGPVVEDIRGGVRPFGDEGIGICQGKRTCDEYLGTDVGELPEGEFIVKAELRVPNAGELGTWKVTFDTECTTTRTTSSGESSSTSNSSRSTS